MTVEEYYMVTMSRKWLRKMVYRARLYQGAWYVDMDTRWVRLSDALKSCRRIKGHYIGLNKLEQIT